MFGVWAARLARSAPLPTALEYLVALTLCLFLLLFSFFREIALQVAATAPLLSRPKRSMHTGHVYPHVFDALAETQRATAFISDTKVLHDAD